MPTSAERAARARKAHSRSGSSRGWAIIAGAGAAVAVVFGVLLVVLSGGGDGSDGSSVAAGRTGSQGTTATVDLSKRPGGLLEGAAVLPEPPAAPPAEELRASGGRRFSLPVKAHAGIEDYFGTPRLYGMRHAGIDFSFVGLSEIPVGSPCDGTVTSKGESPELGLHLVIGCGDGWSVALGFLEVVSVTDGQRVTSGMEIGEGSPGEHLHVEIRYKGSPVDPVGYLDVPPRTLPTPTPTATFTPSVTPAPRPNTPTPSSGGGGPTARAATATPTPKFTSIPTETPTTTPTPTITNTPTWTPTPTRTPRPAATPTPVVPISR